MNLLHATLEMHARASLCFAASTCASQLCLNFTARICCCFEHCDGYMTPTSRPVEASRDTFAWHVSSYAAPMPSCFTLGAWSCAPDLVAPAVYLFVQVSCCCIIFRPPSSSSFQGLTYAIFNRRAATSAHTGRRGLMGCIQSHCDVHVANQHNI